MTTGAPEPEISRRFRVLVEQMLSAGGEVFGTKRNVAERLLLHPTDISKVLAGTRLIGQEVAYRAAENIGLNQRWFTMQWPDDGPPPNFLNFIQVESDFAMRKAGRDLGLVDLRKRARAVFDHRVKGRPFDASKALRLAEEVLEMHLVQLAREVIATPRDDHKAMAAAAYALADGILEIPVRDPESADDDDLLTLREATITDLERALSRRKTSHGDE